MSIKFADGSEEHLTPESVGLIRNAVACAVVLFERQERIRFLETLLAEQTSLTKRRFDELSQLGRELTGVLSRATTETEHLGRVSDRIREVTSDEVAVEVRRVRERFETDWRTTKEEIATLTREWQRFVEELVLHNDLPGSRGRIRLDLGEDGSYQALLRVDNDADMTATFRLRIPKRDAFAGLVRVGDVLEQVKVRVPQRSWLLGDRVSKRSLDRYLIKRVVYTGETTLVRLRTGKPDDVGFDLRFARAGAVVIRAVGFGEPKLGEHVAEDIDAERLRELERELIDMIVPLTHSRAETLAVRLGGATLDAVSPTEVADRIITSVAALMRNVRRVLHDERVGLTEMIGRLPVELQQHFRPLGLVRGQTLPAPPPPLMFNRQRTRRPTTFSELNRGWERRPVTEY